MAQLILPIAVFAVLYFVMILPQQRRQREAAALLAALEVGDEVVLSSGIHGFITELESSVVWIEVAEGTELKVSRSAVASKVSNEAEDESAD